MPSVQLGPDPSPAPAPSPPPRFQGRAAVVTGAASGAGRAQGGGRVVIIRAGSGRHAEACAYVASKWGLIGLAKTAPESAKSDDIAAAGLFLLTDEARFISGDTLSMDGADCAKWT